VVSRCFAALGKNLSPDELKKRGEMVLKEKYAFKLREGFSFEGLRVPKRITETSTPQGMIKEEDLLEGVRAFRKLILGTEPGPP